MLKPATLHFLCDFLASNNIEAFYETMKDQVVSGSQTTNKMLSNG
jgi:hypothetical protein